MGRFEPKCCTEFSTCTDVSTGISSRSKTSSCRLAVNSLETIFGSGWPSSRWDELEDDYAAKFCKRFGALAKRFRMALGALIIKARLGLTDERLVEQIKENSYLQLLIGLEAFQYSAPFDLSMMVYLRKRLPEAARSWDSLVSNEVWAIATPSLRA